MKWISLLTLIPAVSFALPVAPNQNFRMHLNNEYVVQGEFDKGKKISEWKYFHKNGNLFVHPYTMSNQHLIKSLRRLLLNYLLS